MRPLIASFFVVGCMGGGEKPLPEGGATIEALSLARIEGLKREASFDDASWLDVTAGFYLVNEAAAKERRFALPEPLPVREELGERVLLIAQVDGVKRFVVASEARYDRAAREVVLQGGELRHGQAYVVLEPKRGFAVATATGTAVLRRGDAPDDGSKDEAVPAALVASPATPLVAYTDAAGRFALPLAAGTTAVVTASKTDVALALHAPGALMAASAVVGVAPPSASPSFRASAVVRPLQIAEARRSGGAEHEEAAAPAPVTLVFDMPYAPLPGALRTPAPLALTEDERPEIPAAGLPPAREPKDGAAIVQWDDNERHSIAHADLGCAGFDQASRELPLVFDMRRFEDQATKAWRARGGVRVTGEKAAELVGDPQAVSPRHPDTTMGYCALVTGLAAAERAEADGNEAPWLRPGKAQSADLWQRVTIPSSARSLQARIGVLTQDPDGLDGVTLRFEEAVAPIFAAPVKSLPLEEAAFAAFDVDAFTWRMPPRLVCRDLADDERGRTMTLRASAFKGGEPGLATALLVDTVAFSRRPCGDPEGRITAEDSLPR